MLRRVSSLLWEPQGVPFLEDIGLRIVKSDSHLAVQAGPGAGKTEMLAQRACYLLQTGKCPWPRNILALSYKRDSARVIRERVSRRLGEESVRFHSVTLDSFAKHLLDRFQLGLPNGLRPDQDYVPYFPKRPEIETFLSNLSIPSNLNREELLGVSGDTFILKYFCAEPLEKMLDPDDVFQFASGELFRVLMEEQPSKLTFPMIARLVEYLLANNERVSKSLVDCYSHVFMDEFQDTTFTQYGLIKTAFQNSSTILTVVGDGKQKIMTFAGAMEGAFDRFALDFDAPVERPVINYRAAPKLVQILRILAKTVETQGADMEKVASREDGGECKVFSYATSTREAEHVSDLIARWIGVDNLLPDDICILTKMKPAQLGAELASALVSKKIGVRIESEETDFLGEDATFDCLNMLRLAFLERSPSDYEHVHRVFEELYGLDEFGAVVGVDVPGTIDTLLRDLRGSLGKDDVTMQTILIALNTIIRTFGRETYCLRHSAYAQGEWLDSVLKKIAAELHRIHSNSGSWPATIDEVLGKNVVTITTVHKSKGREYHSVVFLSVDDYSFFSFDREPDESMRAFFVAFSRARERVVITFSRVRNNKNVQVDKIRPIYNSLQQAGAEFESII